MAIDPSTAGLFSPTLDEPAVRVTSTVNGIEFNISWDPQSGSQGFRVYAGFDPLHIRSLISGVDVLPSTQTQFTFKSPPFPPNQIIYFWVSTTDGTTETFLDDYGSYTLRTQQSGRFPTVGSDQSSVLSPGSLEIACMEDDRFYSEEIRRRSKAIVEATSEDVDVFIKQWRGLPDPESQEAVRLDPNFHTMTRSDTSFGSGFFPGYFPAIRIRMRFGALPVAQLDFQLPGLRPLLTNEAWTIWDPILHENDLIVRVQTGQRYVVDSVALSNWRGVTLTQRIALDVVNANSPLQSVTDQKVRERWETVNAADFLRTGFGVAADDAGGPDFLIFA